MDTDALLRRMVAELTFVAYDDPDDGPGYLCPYCHRLFRNRIAPKHARLHGANCAWRLAKEALNGRPPARA